MEELHRELSRLVQRGGPGIVLSANAHGLNLCLQLPWLASFYHRADLVYVDGAGVVLGARLLGHRIPRRTTMADWGQPAARYLAEKGHSLFLLGNPPGVAELAARRLKDHAPGLKILGTHHGYFQKKGRENEEVLQAVNRLEPDILMVGLGMPLEQQWMMENLHALRARVLWEVGAAFEFWAGMVSRCPRWMADSGLEWLYRLYLEPRRMARRYLLGNASFMLEILKERRRNTRRSI